ncbi:hypothetical protein QTI24_28435 [Variovorax sp. J22P240]|uniref:hypothetical protein n=1 Tax=Variovorax sp. J22P240 TaxID=3053514 RepID=UPI002577976F|nr:hypothetical protein [Variovorax sp. J22P240]MDM0002561.1 hypothetical protein [Variovorax sp. J22P240]
MNPASRLLAIYDNLVSSNEEQPMVRVWARVFDFNYDKATIEDDLTACLIGLRGEIDYARLRLSEHGVPLELTDPGFMRLKDVAAPARLHTGWNSLRGNVQPPECRQAFLWGAWILREEDEDVMPGDDMQGLKAELEALEVGLKDAAMSPFLREFVQKQVDAIRAALRLYAVQGSRPLHDALHTVAGAWTVSGARVEAESAKATPEAKSVVARAAQAIRKTAEVCDSLDKIRKAGEGAWSLATTVGPLVLPYIAKQIGNS